MKFIILGLLLSGIYFLFFKKPKSVAKKPTTNSPKTSDMIECKVCRTFCSIDDAIQSGSNYYCSSECLKKS
ncbi:MAG: PP0621 family protein [Sulfuricurvum sp.]